MCLKYLTQVIQTPNLYSLI